MIPTPTLPIEICEMIIDACAEEHDGSFHWYPPRRAPLLACALTCKAWLPRALIGLYRTVYLNPSGNRRCWDVLDSCKFCEKNRQPANFCSFPLLIGSQASTRSSDPIRRALRRQVLSTTAGQPCTIRVLHTSPPSDCREVYYAPLSSTSPTDS